MCDNANGFTEVHRGAQRCSEGALLPPLNINSVCKAAGKHKSYFIVNVMDLRKKDKFYSLHTDTSVIAKEVGFSLEDIIIWDRQQEYNNMRPLGYPYKFIVNKVHEYLLIFRKL